MNTKLYTDLSIERLMMQLRGEYGPSAHVVISLGEPDEETGDFPEEHDPYFDGYADVYLATVTVFGPGSKVLVEFSVEVTHDAYCYYLYGRE